MKLSQHTHLIPTWEACLKSRCEEKLIEDVDANIMGKFGIFVVNTDYYY